jgi:hypothetical protein
MSLKIWLLFKKDTPMNKKNVTDRKAPDTDLLRSESMGSLLAELRLAEDRN